MDHHGRRFLCRTEAGFLLWSILGFFFAGAFWFWLLFSSFCCLQRYSQWQQWLGSWGTEHKKECSSVHYTAHSPAHKQVSSGFLDLFDCSLFPGLNCLWENLISQRMPWWDWSISCKGKEKLGTKNHFIPKYIRQIKCGFHWCLWPWIYW